MIKALKAIDSISNLSDKRNYEYSASEVAQITDALKEAVSNMENMFLLNLKTNTKEFTPEVDSVSLELSINSLN